MPNPIFAILIGAGQRGAGSYAPYALRYPEQVRFVAVAEPDPARRLRFAAQHQIPPENAFESWEPLLSGPKLGDQALMAAFLRSQGRAAGGFSALTTVDQSLESHLLAFAAERARLEKKVIDMPGYRKGL